MKKRKALTMLTAVSLSAAMLALSACGTENAPAASKTEQPKSTDTKAAGQTTAKKDPITFTYFLNAPGDNVPDHTKLGDIIKEKTGVTIKYERVVGEIEQKLGVMIAGGDYPDLIYGGDKMFKLIDAKALIPLEDLIEKNAPNLKKIYGPYWDRIKAADGHIYALPYAAPTGKPNKWVNAAFWVQKQVLKEAGYPKITTFDQYTALLRDYAKKHPKIDGADTIPFEVLTYDFRNFTLTTAMQFLAGGPNDSRAMVNPETNQLTFYQTDENITKKYYNKLNDLYNEGLLDKEAFVMNYDQYLAKLSSGRVLGMFDQSWQFQDATAALKQQGKLDQVYAPLQLTFDDSIKADYLDTPTMNYGFGFGISVKAKDPVRAIQFADFMASDEIQVLKNWGVKDQDYKVDDKGRFYRTPEQREFFKVKENMKNWSGEVLYFWPGSSGTLPDGNNFDPGNQPEEMSAGYTDTDKAILKSYGVPTYEELFNAPNLKRKYFPIWSIELSDKAKIFDQKLNDINKKYPPQMVVAKTKADFDKSWNEYVGTVNKLDVAGWMDELTKKVKERQEKWK
ncbi:ABC transporter substrate-binding protein [Paenibacillus sp. SI8]|uniref:ABC transporter substrate-binding protein n=1 Tax=unclassified Paenibacillus TaxID=185978 RepID=UPI003465CA43